MQTDWEVRLVSICLKDELVFLWLCLSTVQRQAIEHSRWMGWWLTTMVLEWLCCHVSTTGLGVISSGPWGLSHNDNIRLVGLSLGSECLATHFTEKRLGSILYTLQVVVITLYSQDILFILCWMGGNNRGFENTSPDYKSHFQTPFAISSWTHELCRNHTHGDPWPWFHNSSCYLN